jgi:hypothetical protein
LKDLFISHAGEDKAAAARPLFNELARRGMSVWYDEFSLSLGDNLRREIDKGLAESRFGVVILSHHFFAKKWPQDELDGLAQKEAGTGEKVILPVWHGLTADDVRRHSLMLAGRKAASTTDGINVVADAITDVVWRDRNRPDRNMVEELFAALPAPARPIDPEPDFPLELGCPKCRHKAMHRGDGSYLCDECSLWFVGTRVAA